MNIYVYVLAVAIACFWLGWEAHELVGKKDVVALICREKAAYIAKHDDSCIGMTGRDDTT